MFGQGSSLFATGHSQPNLSQGQSQPNTEFLLFNKQAANTIPIQNNPISSGTSSLFTQNNQNQINKISFPSNLPNSNVTNNPPNTVGNISTSKAKIDFFHSKLSLQNITKNAQDEIYNKIVKQYCDFSNNNNLKTHLQLESLDLNLDNLDHMILPDYLKFKKSLFQLAALTEKNKKNIVKTKYNLDSEKAQAFLSDQGINISKIDKEINDIKNYLISTYDFSQDLNKINLSTERSILDDKTKMHLSTTTNALWVKTNDNINFADNFIKKNKKDFNYFKKMIYFQTNELENYSLGAGSSIRDNNSASSNLQSANKFVQGGSTNKLLFGLKNNIYPTLGKNKDFKNSNGGKSEKFFGNVNSAIFTPMKYFNINISNLQSS